MLGRLARWLRLLGYDTLFAAGLNDAQLVRLARVQGRVILTRDTGLVRRKGVSALLIVSQDLSDQVAQVTACYLVPPAAFLSRCPACNQPLGAIPKEQVAGRVPPYVFATQERFRVCPGCGRLFWRGTHWEHIRGQAATLTAPPHASPTD
jgi:uncharacterized protein